MYIKSILSFTLAHQNYFPAYVARICGAWCLARLLPITLQITPTHVAINYMYAFGLGDFTARLSLCIV